MKDQPVRTDPFARGLAARRDQVARDACPHPAAWVEARLWLTGWDHGDAKTPARKTGVRG